MAKIRVLSDQVANQIAAGEVVERPASVAKELVENSIDAGAKRVVIEIEAGGRRLLKVNDDGEGMTRDDAILAFERHATSKINRVEDLEKINTLGFRGEALASIASVSKIELITHTEQEPTGTRVKIEGGKLRNVDAAAHPQGTTISMRDLFFNVPARRKFLRSEATETYHLTNLVTHYALAHPEISFQLYNNGRESLRAASASSLRERAYQVFGAEFLEDLLEVNWGKPELVRVKGFVSAPRTRRTTRDSQYFFVNGRFVRDRLIARALTESYHSVLPSGVYPVAIIFLELPAEEVDVNVHPAKTEVRFRRSAFIADTIREGVRAALRSAGMAPPVVNLPPTDLIEEVRTIEPLHEISQSNIDFSSHAPIPKQQSYMEEAAHFTELARAAIARSAAPSISENITSAPVVRGPLPPLNSASESLSEVSKEAMSRNIRPLGQLQESFIIATDEEGLLLVDQHVAHERILFDKYSALEQKRTMESQLLLVPEIFDLTPAQTTAYEALSDDLEQYGFSIMRLSGRTVALKAIPVDLPAEESRNLLSELLDTADEEKRGTARMTFRNKIAASLACKAAIKINTPLTQEKMLWLIDRLLTTSSPTTCPHGRPIILRITTRDIERGFHRP
jgi:DNA mismatch repair protein MutL